MIMNSESMPHIQRLSKSGANPLSLIIAPQPPSFSAALRIARDPTVPKFGVFHAYQI